jgi:hypothetical protein
MKIPSKKGRVFHLNLQEKESGRFFDASVQIKFDRQERNLSFFSFSVIGLLLKHQTAFFVSRILNRSSHVLIPEAGREEFIKMSLAHANRWSSKTNPIDFGGFSVRVGKRPEENFKSEMNRFPAFLEKSPKLISAMKQIVSRYFDAQDRQVLDHAGFCKWTNDQIRGDFIKATSSIDGRDVYGDDYTVHFDEVFGRNAWSSPSPDASDIEVIALGIEPYPFIVCLCALKGGPETRVVAKIDGKFYNEKMYVGANSPEKQIEIAVMLTMTNVVGENCETVPAKTQA